MTKTYSFLKGIAKTIENTLVFWFPALIAFLENVPVEYAVAASAIIYLLKNYIKNR